MKAIRSPGTIGEALLEAEAKMGELLKGIDKSKSLLHGQCPHRGSSGGTTVKTLPEGITKKQSHYCQQLYEHPEVIEEI